VTLLDDIAEVRVGDADFVAIHVYASDRLLRSAHADGGPGATLPPLPQPALQRVLNWLTREELAEGAAALRDGEYVRAATILDGINRIDDRGAKAAFLQATAMYRSVVTTLAKPRPAGLAAAEENLRRAGTLIERASSSDEFRDRAERLGNQIDGLKRLVASQRLIDPVRRRFDAIVARYTGHTITQFDARTARGSLATLSTDVTKLRRKYPSQSDEGRTLAALAEAIIDLQRQLRPYV
jgi:hypothetical protein